MECEDLHSNFDSNFELFIVEEVVPHWEDMCVDNSAQRWLDGLICKQCHRCVAVQVDQKWKPVSQLLANKQGYSVGWREAKNNYDLWLQALLNNVVFYLNEPPDPNNQETDYSLPCHEDKVFLCWTEESLAGFCTMKTKGSKIPGTFCDTYSMDIVDSIFVSRTFRRKGLVTKLVQILTSDSLEKNLGFSNPLSLGMKKLLLKYLQSNSHQRDKFWLCLNDGSDADKLNIWMLQNENKTFE